MKYTQSLPEPGADALAHSQKLIERIRLEIDQSSEDAIPFRRFMEMALYEPGLGYYVAGTHKIGAAGDFTTAPEISSLFSRCIAEQYAQIVSHKVNSGENRKKVGGCTFNTILELGAGSGRMASDILLHLEAIKRLPEHYFILDLSPDLKQRQKETLKKHAPHLLNKVEWLSTLPEDFKGIIIGNEVLDAMPVDVFTQQNDAVYEHYVIWQDGQLLEQLRPANDLLQKSVLELGIPEEFTPYTSEINPNLEPWFRTISNAMQQGVMLLIDYGYSRKEYYHPQRNKGTLICHYQHLVNEAPLLYPGLQDITANVDFTAVAETADSTGFNVAGYTNQAAFLANTRLESLFMNALESHPEDQYKLAQQVRTLSLPAEMGERFKVIGLSKNWDSEISGFSKQDQKHRL